MMKRIATITLAIFALGGCSNKTDDAGKQSPAAGKTEDKPAKPTPTGPDFSAWDQAAKVATWQGSWVVKENGTLQAWNVDGDKVRTFDGKEEKQFTLEAAAPCRVYFKSDKGMKFPRDFASTDGNLRFRAGGAGYRKGAEALFCDASGGIYMFDGKTCTLWEDDFGKWKKQPGECGFKKADDGTEMFFHGDPNGGDFALDGDAILSRTSVDTTRYADYEAAKKLGLDDSEEVVPDKTP